MLYRLRRWLPWMLIVALAIASRIREPWARAAVAKLRVAAGCGFVPGGPMVAALAQAPIGTLPPAVAVPARRPTQRECANLVAGSIPR